MAICLILDNPDETDEQLQQVMAHLAETGPMPPKGLILFAGGRAGDVLKAVSVWDSAESMDRFFADRLGPTYRHVGVNGANVVRTTFKPDVLFTGELVGVASPA